ncbi:MAG: TRAP transporter small permease [Sphaerochaetaceae bacterium]
MEKPVSSWISALDTVENCVLKVENLFFVIVVGSMAASTCIEVVLRYVFNTTLLVGISELINWCFVWIVFWGMATLVKTKSHIGLTFFVEKLPGKIQKIVSLILNGLLLYFFIQVIIVGFRFSTQQKTILTTAANIPKTYLYLAVPVGSILICFHLLMGMVKTLVDFKGKN